MIPRQARPENACFAKCSKAVAKRVVKPDQPVNRSRVANETNVPAKTLFDTKLVGIVTNPLVETVGEGGTCGMRSQDYSSADIVGRGAFATVFASGPHRCVKVERTISAVPLKSKIRCIEIARRMGDAGLAPRVHAWKIMRHEGTVCVVLEMDRVNGQTVRGWLSDEQREGANVKATCDRIENKVASMHRLGIRHNDLHVANVMLDRAGTPWLIDFTFSSIHDLGGTGNEAPALVSAVWHEHGVRTEMRA
jgi:hypothetical protein